MTREQNIEIIRKACIQANPDILKLEFGCEVELNKEAKSERMTVVKLLGKTGEYVVTYQDGTQGLYQPEELKIIGRPIRLADVLLVINREHDYFMPHVLREELYFHYKRDGGFAWHLVHDDLTLQSDETLEFLINILK